MKAVVYDAPGRFSIGQVPTPDPKPGEVRVRVQQTGICGTDLHIHNGKFFAEFPLTPGHELVGPVDALGDGAGGLRLGEYVSVNPNMNCGHCEYCRTGRTLMCANLKGLGTNWPGSFAEYVVVPANLVFSVDGIDPDISTSNAEPTACAMHHLETLPSPAAGDVGESSGPTDRPAAGPAHRPRRRGQRERRGVVGVQAPARRGPRHRHDVPDGSRGPAGSTPPS